MLLTLGSKLRDPLLALVPGIKPKLAVYKVYCIIYTVAQGQELSFVYEPGKKEPSKMVWFALGVKGLSSAGCAQNLCDFFLNTVKL